MICNARFHRLGDAQGWVNSPEVVIHIVNSHRMLIVFDFF